MLLHSTAKYKLSILATCVLFTFACADPNGDKRAETNKVENNVELEQDKNTQASEPQPVLPNKPIQHQANEENVMLADAVASTESQEIISVSGKRSRAMAEHMVSHSSINILPSAGNIHYRPTMQHTGPETNSEKYQDIDESEVKLTKFDPVSTFSIDVDTGSYSNARRMLNQGVMPPSDAVRIEEFLNYFDYQYPLPTDLSEPFSVNTAISPAPWDEQKHILRIGLKGYEQSSIASDETNLAKQHKNSNLVFLLDVSGSMNQANKLPLLKRSLTMLTDQLSENDKVSIVVYAGASGVVLEPTDGDNKHAISTALQSLRSGGSTNGAAGIELAYQLAEQAFIKGGVNRVVLATDGDFNVGMSSHDALIELIEKKRKMGIALTTLGFGQGNYNDYLMEQLADAGNGNYAYIDTINEARKVLVDELQSTMQIIAKDVKIQVEFNPAFVAEYRLIGYDNRALANEDFNNDQVDAGDIGAGHKVTALYEITLHNSANKFNDALRYADAHTQNKEQRSAVSNDQLKAQELAHVKLRFKQPDADNSKLIEHTVNQQDIIRFEEQSSDYQFALAVASFAQRVKQSKYTHDLAYDWIVDVAQDAKGEDSFGYRSEFIQLVRTTARL